MTQKCVPQAFSISSTFDKSSNINDSQVGRDTDSLVQITQPIETSIWNSYTTLLWINRTEWKILGTSSTIGDDIEKSGFSTKMIE
jgi:hypothetical protein